MDDTLKDLYLEWIEDYCNVTFGDNPPGPVILALNMLLETDPMDYNVASEKLSDMSKTYIAGSGDNGIPGPVKNWLAPYRRPHLVGDKGKRPYKDGRG